MRLIIFSFVFVLFGCDCSGEKLKQSIDRRCGTSCYGGIPTMAGRGVCNMGKWDCDMSGKIIDCKGWGSPSEITCNGLDNDCDGSVDKFNRGCSTACGKGYETCFNGMWLNCDAPDVINEICDGKDNDCDGIIDNPNQLAIKFCYDGPPETLQYEGCSPGVKRCTNGHDSVCLGQKLPSAEICDGVDNDCDGLVDEGFGAHDIVVIIDYSCSMNASITNVESALSSWAVKYANADYKFAVVASPGPSVIEEGKVILFSNFTDATTFLRKIHPYTSLNTGLEPTIDALRSCIENYPVQLNLNWRAGATRSIILFTDEKPQSNYPDEDGGFASMNDVISSLVHGTQSPPVTVFSFDTLYWLDFQRIVAASGGLEFDILESSAQMKIDLDEIIKKISCSP